MAWLVGVVVFHYAAMFAAGQLIPAEVVYLDWGMLSIWFLFMAAIDLIAVTLLLGAKGAKFLTAVMYASFAWSLLLAIDGWLSSVDLIQHDRIAQFVIFIGILASLAWGIAGCRGSRSQSSS